MHHSQKLKEGTMKEEKNYRKSKNFSLEDKKEVASDAETNGVIYIYFTGGFLMREISRRLKVKKQNQSRLFLSFFFFLFEVRCLQYDSLGRSNARH